MYHLLVNYFFFVFQAEDGIRDGTVTGVQTCALPISFDGHFAMPRLGQKILERRQQIRTQTSPFLPHSFEVPPFEQPRKKSLSEILRFLRFIAFASDESVKRPPVRSTKLF